jgi:Ca2+-binding RTX toxin-like protein
MSENNIYDLDETLYGTLENDTILGYGGNDSLWGQEGNDILIGYGGGRNEVDTLQGGDGSDTFVLGDNYSGVFYRGQTSFGKIADFNQNQDVIQVKGNADEYRLHYGRISGDQALRDTLIYYGSDLIGIVQDTTDVDSAKFSFV